MTDGIGMILLEIVKSFRSSTMADRVYIKHAVNLQSINLIISDMIVHLKMYGK